MRDVRSRYRWEVSRDVEKVKRHARIVLRIDNEGRIVGFHRNERTGLDVLAILGPGNAMRGPLRGEFFNEALLCEIGMRRCRPYHECKKRVHGKMRVVVGKRHKWFVLSEEQYRALGPRVFQFLQAVVDRRTAGWLIQGKFTRQCEHQYFSRRKNAIRLVTKKCEFIRGCRFSISRADHFFINDLLWVEFNSSRIKEELTGLAAYISILLEPYALEGYQEPFVKLPRAKEAASCLAWKIEKSYSRYLIIRMLGYLRGGCKHKLWKEIKNLVAETIKWNGRKTTEEKRVKRAFVKPAYMDLRMRRPVDSLSPTKDYIVFEILPQTAHREKVAL